ncbi:MAG TPA: hypothetical protein PK280_14960 [Planctomycetota bacterium]|nr:hypothetical protein [Planctomycetota bacterium]
MSLLPARAGRPRGVTFLGYFLLGIAGAVILRALQTMIAGLPGAFQAGSGWGALLIIMLSMVLPAIWIGTAGAGLLLGRGWSRGLVLAMAALALVFFAGAVTSAGQQPLRFGALLGALVFTGGASLYLFSHRTDGWFGRKP